MSCGKKRAEPKCHSHHIMSRVRTFSTIYRHDVNLDYLVRYCLPGVFTVVTLHLLPLPYCSLRKHIAKRSLAPFWSLLLGLHFSTHYLKEKVTWLRYVSEHHVSIRHLPCSNHTWADHDSGFLGHSSSWLLPFGSGLQVCWKRGFSFIKYSNFFLKSS